MKEARKQLDPGVIVPIITTEHFTLQTARSSTISEASGRASIFLAVVSGSLVALAFVAQVSRVAFVAFVLVVLPALLFLGIATYERVLQVAYDDVAYLQRINRIRRLYFELAPELTRYLAAPAPDERAASVLRSAGFRPGRAQLLLSTGGAIGVINSVIIGSLAGVTTGVLAQGLIPLAAAVGVVMFVASVALHQAHQRRRGLRAPPPFSDLG
jgi:hypothetical protein